MSGPELSQVEQPFLNQLVLLGWQLITGSLTEPSVTGRESFREVLIKPDLRRALLRINLREGKAWLDDARIAQAIGELERIQAPKLMEANQQATALLLAGVKVPGIEGWEGGRERTVHFIDWAQPEHNTFTAVQQFKLDCPGGASAGSIRPDIVLFVNGIPLVVVECKAPGVNEPIVEAVDQLRRYHNARKQAGEVEADEGNERLFYSNQFLIASSGDDARVGTIGAEGRYYQEWKDTAPVPQAEVLAELNTTRLRSQEMLVAGMLRKAHLLDLVQHFTIFDQSSGKVVKKVCRYQQFRAVHNTIQRLLTGKTRAQDGEQDQRGGIVWHTQGSGKSLTMVFLVRKLRSVPALEQFKVVIITDRRDLEKQLRATAEMTGENVKRAANTKGLKRLLSQKGPALVFAMIQKYRGQDEDTQAQPQPVDVEPLGLLNDDESILVLVDEAHRSHGNTFHAHLREALPNCARIGFTGTPILKADKKRTHEIFGSYIDRYLIKQAEADGATVPILYEGRTAEGAVADGRDLDELFEDMFREHSKEELDAIKQKYATKGAVLEAEKLIAEKARDMLAHYVEAILPNGYKAQVVAFSRRAAVRYQLAFNAAREELVDAAEALTQAERALDDLELMGRPRKFRVAVYASRYLPRLARMQFVAVISGDHNDREEWQPWIDPNKSEARIEAFKRPFPSDAELTAHSEGEGPVAFLIVKSMLLTGFDAPIEGVMYLDRPLRDAELMQAIARVNRTGYGKRAGIVLDYYGLARHLEEAFREYSSEDVDGALSSLDDELPKLRDQAFRVNDLFASRGVDPEQTEEAVQLLSDPQLRAQFSVLLKQFLATLDLMLPSPKALPFVPLSKTLGLVYVAMRRRYREGHVELHKSVGEKVGRLIDEHVISLGIDPRIPPVQIGDETFADHLERQVSPRAKASEMEHALRHHIRKKLDEDPVFYQKLSERLEELLKKYGQEWDQLVLALGELREQVVSGRKQSEAAHGLDPLRHAPFYDLITQARGDQGSAELAQHTARLVEEVIVPAIRTVGFWKNAQRQSDLRGEAFRFLDDNDAVPFEKLEPVADQLMELAKANQSKLGLA